MNTTSVSYPTDHVTLLTSEHVCSIFFLHFLQQLHYILQKNTSLHSARLISSAVIKIFTLSSIDRPHPCYTLCGPQKRGTGSIFFCNDFCKSWSVSLNCARYQPEMNSALHTRVVPKMCKYATMQNQKTTLFHKSIKIQKENSYEFIGLGDVQMSTFSVDKLIVNVATDQWRHSQIKFCLLCYHISSQT